METLRGIATGVIHSSLVVGQCGESMVYDVTFLINGSSVVSLESTRQPVISEGDEVVVAGTCDNGPMRALAYKNISKRKAGNAGIWMRLYGAAVGLAVFCASGGHFPGEVGAIFGVCLFVSAVRIGIAVRTLKGDTYLSPAHEV